MGLKRETITELLQLIESIEICHMKLMTDNLIEDVVRARIDGYLEQLNEAIKADVAQQVEARKTAEWAERYMDRLEKKVLRLEQQRDEIFKANEAEQTRLSRQNARLRRRIETLKKKD
jgi:hypothetical protein